MVTSGIDRCSRRLKLAMTPPCGEPWQAKRNGDGRYIARRRRSAACGRRGPASLSIWRHRRGSRAIKRHRESSAKTCFIALERNNQRAAADSRGPIDKTEITHRRRLAHVAAIARLNHRAKARRPKPRISRRSAMLIAAISAEPSGIMAARRPGERRSASWRADHPPPPSIRRAFGSARAMRRCLDGAASHRPLKRGGRLDVGNRRREAAHRACG